MAKGTAGKNYWALLLMILAGVVLGGFIGQLSAGVPALRWLNYGQTFGLSTPLVLDLGILVQSQSRSDISSECSLEMWRLSEEASGADLDFQMS